MEVTQSSQLIGQEGTPCISTSLDGGSQLHQLVGKTVVAVGGGTHGKRHLWTEARELGIKLVLVDSDPRHKARAAVDTFLHVDFRNHAQDEQHVTTILRLLSKHRPGREEEDGEGVVVDGVITWMEDTVPLTARLGHALGLPHVMSLESALKAKSKERTHTVLGQQGKECSEEEGLLLQLTQPLSLPLLSPAVYASPVVRVNTVKEVAEAVNKISLPAVMKLGYGSGSVGVMHVRTVQEAEQHLRLVQETFRREPNFPGTGLSYGNCMILMPRLLGTEHDVDVVLFESQVVAAYVSDNGPTRHPLCIPTSGLMPSVRPKEQRQELIQAAAACCRGLGLHTGVFNVEMMMTPQGPRLLEINARMGSHNMRDWIRLIYNVDLFHLALMCSCGIRPVVPEGTISSLDEDFKDQVKTEEQEDEDKELQNGYLMGIMLYPSRHAQALATTASPQRLQALCQNGDVFFTHFILGEVPSGTDFELAVGNIAVRGSSLQETKTKMVDICTSLGLETKESVLEVLSFW
ncbi:hypothetical protein ACOMHN_021915 [Nucella lapillus]